MGAVPIADPDLVTTQRLPATRVLPYRKDFPANPRAGDDFVELELKYLTDEVPTTLIIFCTQPFRLRYDHPGDKDSSVLYPIDPLPMGVPVTFRDLDWRHITVTPMLYPAQLRIWSQANTFIEPPPGVKK